MCPTLNPPSLCSCCDLITLLMISDIKLLRITFDQTNLMNENVCPVVVVWWGQPGSFCSCTCAELRAFHLFPSLTPDLPATKGVVAVVSDPGSNSCPARHSGCRHACLHKFTICTNAHAYCFLCMRFDGFDPSVTCVTDSFCPLWMTCEYL